MTLNGVSRDCPKFFSGTGKGTVFKFCSYIHRIHPNKCPLKRLEKTERGYIQGLPNVFKYPPIIIGTGKATIALLSCYSEVETLRSQ